MLLNLHTGINKLLYDQENKKHKIMQAPLKWCPNVRSVASDIQRVDKQTGQLV